MAAGSSDMASVTVIGLEQAITAAVRVLRPHVRAEGVLIRGVWTAITDVMRADAIAVAEQALLAPRDAASHGPAAAFGAWQSPPSTPDGPALLVLTPELLPDPVCDLSGGDRQVAAVLVWRQDPAAGFDATMLTRTLFDTGYVPLTLPDELALCRLYVASARLGRTEGLGVIQRPDTPVVSMSTLGQNGRLANQLFQYAFLKLYALRHEAVCATPPWPGQDLFGLRDMALPVPKLPEMQFFAFDSDDRYLWTMDQPPRHVDFAGYFQELPACWRNQRPLLRRLFIFASATEKAMDKALDRLTEHGRRPLVALHIRRGDYVTLARDGLDWYRPIPVAAYERLLDRLLPGLADPVIYLATDDPAGVVPEFSRYKPVTVAELDAPGVPDNIADFIVLRRAAHLALANSSFSRMAAILAGEEQQGQLLSLTSGEFEPYDAWQDREFWARFGGSHAPDDIRGKGRDAALARSIELRRQRGLAVYEAEQRNSVIEAQLDGHVAELSDSLATVRAEAGAAVALLREEVEVHTGNLVGAIEVARSDANRAVALLREEVEVHNAGLVAGISGARADSNAAVELLRAEVLVHTGNLVMGLESARSEANYEAEQRNSVIEAQLDGHVAELSDSLATVRAEAGAAVALLREEVEVHTGNLVGAIEVARSDANRAVALLREEVEVHNAGLVAGISGARADSNAAVELLRAEVLVHTGNLVGGIEAARVDASQATSLLRAETEARHEALGGAIADVRRETEAALSDVDAKLLGSVSTLNAYAVGHSATLEQLAAQASAQGEQLAAALRGIEQLRTELATQQQQQQVLAARLAKAERGGVLARLRQLFKRVAYAAFLVLALLLYGLTGWASARMRFALKHVIALLRSRQYGSFWALMSHWRARLPFRGARLGGRMDHPLTDGIQVNAVTQRLTADGLIVTKAPSAYPDGGARKLVSVVIPCYNYGAYVREAAASALAQTLQDIEVIIVENGSTDPDTLCVVKEIEQEGRVRVVWLTPNQGLPYARNAGFEVANGEYVCSLDADDLFEPTYIEKAVTLLETDRSVGFAYSWVQLFGTQDSIWQTRDFDPEDALSDNHTSVSAVFRRDDWLLAGRYDPSMHGGYDDWEFWIRLAMLGRRGRSIPEPLLRHRKHGSNMTGDAHAGRARWLATMAEKNPRFFGDAELRARLQRLMPISMDGSGLARFPPQTTPPGDGRDHMLVVVPWLPLGGAEILLHDILNHLARNWRLSIVTTVPGNHDMRARFADITHEIFHLDQFLTPDMGLDFILMLARTRGSRAILSSGSALFYRHAADLRERHPGVKLISLLHNDLPTGHIRSALAADPALDLHLVISDKIRQSLQKGGVSADKIALIENGVDNEAVFSPARIDRAHARTAFGIAAEARVVAFVGRLSEEKRPLAFVSVLKALAGTPGLRAIMVGDGILAEAVTAAISDAGLSDVIIRVGFLRREQVADVYGAADILVLTSTIEGQPLVVLEALASGCPVAATNVGDLPRIISDGRNGYLVDPDRPLDIAARLKIFFDLPEKKRGEMRKASAASVVKAGMTMQQMLAQYEATIARLVTRKAAEPAALAGLAAE
jgi:glycosyltransferase involved in cell wall biosynthesis